MEDYYTKEQVERLVKKAIEKSNAFAFKIGVQISKSHILVTLIIFLWLIFLTFIKN